MFFGPEPQSGNGNGFPLMGNVPDYTFTLEKDGTIVQGPWWYRAAAGIEMIVFEVMQD